MKSDVELSKNYKTIENERELDRHTFGQSMVEVRRLYDKQIMGQVKEMAALAFGKGKVSPAEYYDWQLYRDDLTLLEKQNFVGIKAMREIWKTCNYQQDWRGFMWDKLVFDATLKGFGFPVPSTLFVLKKKPITGPIKSGSTQSEFNAFLRSCTRFPIFCKPVDSYQSLGAVSIINIDAKLDMLRFANGDTKDLKSFTAEAMQYSQEGYIVQEKLKQCPQLKAICGGNISTIRILVMLKNDEASVLNACWKIPTRENIADNYWRNGNKMASINLISGEVGRVVSGTGTNLMEIDDFPHAVVPDWTAVCELAIAASSVLGHFPLLGWDIALTNKGPVIIEANETPDFGLHQIADGAGMRTDSLQSFIQECREAKKIRLANNKARGRKATSREIQQIRAHGKLHGDGDVDKNVEKSN